MKGDTQIPSGDLFLSPQMCSNLAHSEEIGGGGEESKKKEEAEEEEEQEGEKEKKNVAANIYYLTMFVAQESGQG